jgi:hypothetical protein
MARRTIGILCENNFGFIGAPENRLAKMIAPCPAAGDVHAIALPRVAPARATGDKLTATVKLQK